MSALETAIKELKTLPPMQQDEAAQFIHSLKATSKARKQAIIEKTYGCLTPEEATEWETAIQDCSQPNHEGW